MLKRKQNFNQLSGAGWLFVVANCSLHPTFVSKRKQKCLRPTSGCRLVAGGTAVARTQPVAAFSERGGGEGGRHRGRHRVMI